MKKKIWLAKVFLGVLVVLTFQAFPASAQAQNSAECTFLSQDLFHDTEDVPSAEELLDASATMKIDVVFIASGYEDSSRFEHVVTQAIEQAFSGIEPLKSNLHLFRFWLAPVRAELSTRETSDAIQKESIAMCEQLAKGKFDNLFIMNYSNSIGIAGQPSGMASFGEGASIRLFQGKRDDSQQLIDSQAYMILHEFVGHAIAELRDEYTTQPMNEEIRGEGSNAQLSEGLNCFVGSYESCLAESEWSDLIGQGCGEDDTLDCQSEIGDNNYQEVGCYAGCRLLSEGAYRPHFKSIMNQEQQDFFGLAHQREICRKLAGITGDATGYCVEEFGIGTAKAKSQDVSQNGSDAPSKNFLAIFLSIVAISLSIAAIAYRRLAKKNDA